MTRRDFLSASAAAAAAPVLGARASAAPLPRDADIVVIGAGAAGIAAARRIQAANRRVIVVEAAGQIGDCRAAGRSAECRIPGAGFREQRRHVGKAAVVQPKAVFGQHLSDRVLVFNRGRHANFFLRCVAGRLDSATFGPS